MLSTCQSWCPVQGGFLTPPPGFFKCVRDLCDEHGIVLIADEVRKSLLHVSFSSVSGLHRPVPYGCLMGSSHQAYTCAPAAYPEALVISVAGLQVQSGIGRTGKWWAHEHVMDGTPDIVIFAKGIASGFPFAGACAGLVVPAAALPQGTA